LNLQNYKKNPQPKPSPELQNNPNHQD